MTHGHRTLLTFLGGGGIFRVWLGTWLAQGESTFSLFSAYRRPFGAFCLDTRTLAFCQLMGFPYKRLKNKLLAGEQKATEYPYVVKVPEG